LNALAKNWRQKVRISANESDPSRLPAVGERDSEVITVMTCLPFLSGDFGRAERLFGALAGSFWPESLKEGFNCRYP
jgi:hypothetical protein